MPTRRLANSNPTRFRALSIAKELKDAIPAPTIIPFTAPTIARLDTFFPIYKGKIEAAEAALQAQVFIGEQIKAARIPAEYLISDFYDALQRAIRRGVFDASVRVSYGLAANDATIPTVNSEADISFWGGKAATGEATRIAAGGAPITFPAIAEVTTAVNAFKNLNQQQANAKIAFETAQEDIEAQNPEADKLILKMWNEIEATFDEGNKPSMRQKAREWGVIYVPTPGETLNPADFSITGKVADSVTGAGLNDVQLKVLETNTIVTTDSHGDYFVGVQPAATYTIKVNKPGYAEKQITGVVVTAGAITTLNISMTATGTVSGHLQQMGVPAQGNISVKDTTITGTTDPMGNYVLSNVPVGAQIIKASLLGNPASEQTLPVTVTAGGTVTANFSFP